LNANLPILETVNWVSDMAVGNNDFISIVMPVYREAAHIAEVLAGVEKALAEVQVRFEHF